MHLLQEVFIMNDTLSSNIALGENKFDVDRAKILSAISKANLIDLYNSLPDGLNSILGEQAQNYLGGQRQRVAIARAIYC